MAVNDLTWIRCIANIGGDITPSGESSVIESYYCWNYSDESQGEDPTAVPDIIKYPSGYENDEFIYTELEFEEITNEVTNKTGVKISNVPAGCRLYFVKENYEFSVYDGTSASDTVSAPIPDFPDAEDNVYYAYCISPDL